jgi:hypothetical protein
MRHLWSAHYAERSDMHAGSRHLECVGEFATRDVLRTCVMRKDGSWSPTLNVRDADVSRYASKRESPGSEFSFISTAVNFRTLEYDESMASLGLWMLDRVMRCILV